MIKQTLSRGTPLSLLKYIAFATYLLLSLLPDAARSQGSWNPATDPVKVYFVHRTNTPIDISNVLTINQITPYDINGNRKGHLTQTPALGSSEMSSGLHEMSLAPGETFKYTYRNGDKLQVPGFVLMDYEKFYAAWDYDSHSTKINWNLVDPNDVYVPDEISLVKNSGSSSYLSGTASYNNINRDYSNRQVLYLDTYNGTEPTNALKVSATAKPSLKLAYDGSRYEVDATGLSHWKIPVVITNSHSIPVYVKLGLSFVDNTTSPKHNIKSPDELTGDHKYYAGGGSYGMEINQALLLAYSQEKLYFVAPGISRTIELEVLVNPSTSQDYSITANVNCSNMASTKLPNAVNTSVTTFFPKATSIVGGLKVNESYPKTIAPLASGDEPVKVTLIGANMEKMDPSTLQIKQGSNGTDVSLTDQKLYNHSANQASFFLGSGDFNGDGDGSYIVSFGDLDGYTHYVNISVQTGYNAPLWPMYGMMVVSQPIYGGSLLVDPVESEIDFKLNYGYDAWKRDPLLVFRGINEKVGGAYGSTDYMVHSGASINGVLQYFCKEADEADADKRLLKVTLATNGAITVQSQSTAAVLVYDNTVVASGIFRIVLDPNTNYSSSRTPNEGETKIRMVYGEGNNPAPYLLDIRGINAKLGGIILYNGACSLTGKIDMDSAMPEFLRSFFTLDAELDELQLGGSGLPAMKAHLNSHAGFDLFTVAKAGGDFQFSMNTLPDAGNDAHIRLFGSVDLMGIIEAEGELNLLPGLGYYIPETFKVYAKAQTGIPLLPMFPVATINGLGGGFDGLASTITRTGYEYLPNVSLTLSMGVADITGKLLGINRGNVTVGTRGISGKSSGLTLIGMEILTEVGYSIQLFEGKELLRIGGKDIYMLGAKVGAFGSFSLLDIVKGSASVSFAFDPTATNWDETLARIKAGNFGNAFWDITDCINFLGTASATGSILGYDFVQARTEISKYRALIWASLPSYSGINWGEVGIEFRFPYRGASPGFSVLRTSMDTGVEIGSFYDDSGNKIVIAYTNLIRKTPVSSTLRASGPFTVSVGPNEPSLMFTLKSATNTVTGFTVTGPNNYSFTDNILTDNSNKAWIEVKDADGNITGYQANYLIANPDAGDWAISTTSDGITLEAFTLLPQPKLENIAYNNNGSVDFDATDLDASKTYVADLFVTSQQLPQTPGLGDYLGQVALSNGSGQYTEAVTMPAHLPSGNYVITAVMSEVGPDSYKASVNSDVSSSFAYTNPSAPSAPNNVTVAANGNGTVKVSWDAVTGADGYMVQILDANGDPIKDSEGDELTALRVDALNTEMIVQGGATIVTKNTGSAESPIDIDVTSGYDYSGNYTASVMAFTNTKIGEKDDETGTATEDVYAPVYSPPTASSQFQFTEPTPPSISFVVDAANESANSTTNWKIYAGNTPEVKLTIASGASYTIVDGQNTQSGTSSGADIVLNNLTEGEHTFSVTATNAQGDDNQILFTVIVDKTPPLLSLDSKISLQAGVLQLSGLTDDENIELTMNGASAGFVREKGVFSFTGNLSGTLITIIATDEAGNTTTVSKDIADEIANYANISVTTDIGSIVPEHLMPNVLVTGVNLLGDITVITGASLSITDGPGSATIGQGDTFTPASVGTVQLTAILGNLSASAIIEIVENLPVTASYTITGPTSVTLEFTPAVGSSTASLEYSSDGENWSAYGQAFDPATGLLSNLATDMYHYFRLNVADGINKGISNVAVIYLDADIATYTVTLNSEGTGATGAGDYAEGATVNITAGTPPSGKQFSGWTANPAVTFDNPTGASASFTMPASAVTITANFAPVDVPTDPDLADIYGAINLIQFSTIQIPQAAANTEADVRKWLEAYLSDQFNQMHYYVSVSDIIFSLFEAAIEGSAGNASGTNGAITFSAIFSKGSQSVQVSFLHGVIVATSYVDTGTEVVAKPALKAVADKGVLVVSGLSAGEELKLYNLFGALIYNVKAAASEVRLDVEPGVYIVVSGGRTAKISVR